jgi:ankyrin repeat protein
MSRSPIRPLVLGLAFICAVGTSIFLVQQASDRSRSAQLVDAVVAADLVQTHKLLRSGVSVNARDSGGGTVLMWAAWGQPGPEKPTTPQQLQVVKLLLDRGAAVNARGTRYRCTALMWAAMRNRPQIARMLLHAGADPLARSTEGLTAADYARIYGAVEALKALSESGSKH